jgi:hypothetical protein
MTSLAQPAPAARGHFFKHELESFPNDLDVFPKIFIQTLLTR